MEVIYNSLPLLIAGTFVVIWSMIFSGRYGALSLRTMAVGVIWIGYFASPLLAIIDGEYERWMLLEHLIPSVLQYALMCMIAVCLGWGIFFKGKSQTRKMKYGFHLRRRIGLPLDRYYKWYLPSIIALCILTFVLFIIVIGGFENFWVSSITRGAGQFQEHTLAVKIKRTVYVLKGLITMSCCLLGAIITITGKRGSRLYWWGVLAMIIGTIPAIHSLSRGAGIAFAFLAFAGLLFRGKKFLFKAILLMALAVIMGQVGLQTRGDYYPGIGSYCSGVHDLVASVVAPHSNDHAVRTVNKGWAEYNPLDQIPAATQVFQIRSVYSQSLDSAFIGLLTHINPFPAALITLKPFGISSLSEWMGAAGSVGITVPALAQTYCAMGTVGVILWFGVGILCAWVYNCNLRFRSALTMLAVFMVIAGLVIGLHSQLRAMIRPIQVSIILCLLEQYGFFRRVKGNCNTNNQDDTTEAIIPNKEFKMNKL